MDNNFFDRLVVLNKNGVTNGIMIIEFGKMLETGWDIEKAAEFLYENELDTKWEQEELEALYPEYKIDLSHIMFYLHRKYYD